MEVIGTRSWAVSTGPNCTSNKRHDLVRLAGHSRHTSGIAWSQPPLKTQGALEEKSVPARAHGLVIIELIRSLGIVGETPPRIRILGQRTELFRYLCVVAPIAPRRRAHVARSREYLLTVGHIQPAHLFVAQALEWPTTE